ncbi:Serine-threonine/tyrosine-protein kinase, catalytic domain [Dillenia turbinata]|uniref:Serine-threonine/tyrosine-protein kinase, catalytic domain n=1 Tax=Dillenia turbinata TaxID=194707 RepID=A0AAN8W3A6_9MAGN
MKLLFFSGLASLFLFLSFVFSLSHALNSDGLSLLALKSAITTDPTHIFSTWSEYDSTPCHWPGIKCNPQNKVTEISLSKRGFNGYIPSEIAQILSLQKLCLSYNNFTNPIPLSLFNDNTSSLLSLDLSHNSLTGSVPNEIRNLRNLCFLDLSSNLLNGSLPDKLSELQSLGGTLNLSHNLFSGAVPTSYGNFPVRVSLDLRYNNLTGKIPQTGSLLNQGPTAFSGNPNLCGFPLQVQCPEAQNPNLGINPENPRNPNVAGSSFTDGVNRRESGGVGISVISVISGVCFVVGVVFASLWLIRKRGTRRGDGKKGKEENKEEKREEGEEQNGKFVVLDEGFVWDLEDLLRASAYVVGKSRSGIVYKVVVGRGSGVVEPTVVAVKRLSEGDGSWRFKDFDAEVEAIGKVEHPNLVRLRAYYFASDEKLLVSDFIKNGSLYNALHGGPSNTLPTLSWAARLKIAQGIARGLLHIHECSPRKYVHGNLKSSKILLDEDLLPYISGFGLTRLTSGAKPSNSASKRQSSSHIIVSPGMGLSTAFSVAYKAPEARVSGSRFTQKCDVYSFGIIIMEILTGQLPDAGPENDGKGLEGLVRKVFREERPLSEIIDPALLHEVYAKKQVIAAFHIALNCTELDPELRPRMRTVSESLDRIKSQ